MKAIRYIAFILLLPLLLTTCMREPFPEMANGSDGWLLTFSAPPAPEIVVSTKSTMTDENSEFDVYNLYVLVFDKEGNKIWGQEFKLGDKVVDSNPAIGKWTYSHTTKTGKVHLQSARSSDANSADCKIVIIANLNSEMVNVTPAQLQGVANWTAMCNVQATLLQKITSRSGYFPMYGELTGVKLLDTGMSFTAGSVLNLKRLDARIEFNVTADHDLAYGIQDFVPLTWQVINLPVVSSVVEGEDGATKAAQFFDGLETNFEKETPLGTDIKYESGKTVCTHGFSFYMMENEKDPENTPPQKIDPVSNEPIFDGITPVCWEYQDRDKQKKDGNGKNIVDSNNKPVFQYAPDLATYVVLRGRLIVKTNGEERHAEVKYVIHLGDFGATSPSNKQGNFSIKRNHKYIYNITIQGVNKIRAEVMDAGNPEAEPGASGNIAVPVRKYFECDSHYTTHTMEFKLSDIKDDGGNLKPLGWWVRTPFNPDGKPSNTDGSSTDNTDYKWVEFRVNVDQITAGSGSSFTYNDNVWTTYQPHSATTVPRTDYKYVVNPSDDNNPYKHPTSGIGISPTMYIDELMDFLAVAAGKVPGTTLPKDAFDDDDRIVVTAFINEFYYEKHPFKEDEEDNKPKLLWKQFVNQPMRTMCILSSVDKHSPDGESWVEQATYVIQQHSIQSVYNVNSAELNSGWGVEYMDDAREKSIYRAKGKDAQKAYSPNTGTNAEKYRQNSNPDNGRWDTMIEWGLRTASDATFDNSKSWSTFLNLTEENEGTSYMKGDYQYIRYTCLSRNRDNNGNGVIDKSEVRWYLAASNQLINLFLGSYGIEGAAGLYQRAPEDRTNNDPYKWRQHVLASNCEEGTNVNSNDRCRIVWAEEGLTGSVLNKVEKQNNALVTARCARNFGFDPNSGTQDLTHGGDITYSSEDAAPDYLIDVKCYDERTGELYGDGWSDLNKYKYAYFDVDCSRVNEKSLRYYTDRELAPHDEFEEASCLYKRFRTTSINGSNSWPNGINAKAMNQAIDDASANEYCPVGYRLPNIRELGILCYFLPSASISENFITKKGGFTFARTKWSFGNEGSQAKASVDGDDAHTKWGFAIGKDGNYKALVANHSGTKHSTTSVRCVKDVKQ